jgi:hypothetical protein
MARIESEEDKTGLQEPCCLVGYIHEPDVNSGDP